MDRSLIWLYTAPKSRHGAQVPVLLLPLRRRGALSPSSYLSADGHREEIHDGAQAAAAQRCAVRCSPPRRLSQASPSPSRRRLRLRHSARRLVRLPAGVRKQRLPLVCDRPVVGSRFQVLGLNVAASSPPTISAAQPAAPSLSVADLGARPFQPR
ncbi:Non-specific serine/threonine protein kinase [Psidium guajava]|nr:Non-specific serine/threonine protein kinase [Psidium guajava]